MEGRLGYMNSGGMKKRTQSVYAIKANMTMEGNRDLLELCDSEPSFQRALEAREGGYNRVH